MVNEIIVTSPEKRTTILLEKVKSEFDLNLVVYETTFEDAVNVVCGISSQKPDRVQIVASGGATLKLIREDLGIMPWVNIFPAEYDLLIALEQARITKKRIGLLVPGQINLDEVKKLCSILRIQVQLCVYNNWQELLIQIEKAYQDSIEVVIGTGEKISYAVQERGMQYISVVSGENTIRKALKRAQYILDHIRKEKIASDHMKAITNFSHEGIVATNEKMIISIFNSRAAKFFGISEEKVLGRSLQELSSHRDLVSLFEDSSKNLNCIHQMPNGAILVNKVPLINGHHSSGILITFKEVNKEGNKNKQGKIQGSLAKYHFSDIIHNNSKMTEVITKAIKYANTDCNVLIKGETGTGKELISQSIHNGHRIRCKNAFVAVNCATIDANLLNSELFGYSEGSFTGAIKGGKPGLFELAQGGSLFLDEIGKMKWEAQANLLRVLQEKEIRRIGSDRVIPVDVRIIAASNEELQDLVKRGEFREDLYYRLNVLKLTLPPLRERRGDIPHLVTSFIKRYTQKYNKAGTTPSEGILEKISNMDWPGNIRQLEHFIERCIVMSEDENDLQVIIADLLEEEFPRTNESLAENIISLPIRSLEEINTEIVQSLKARAKLSNSELAMRLGISRPTLLKILNRNRDEITF